MYKQIRNSRYEINEKGEIRNENGYVLKQQEKDGYKTISINLGDGAKKYRVHRLVAEAFIPNSKGLPEINHKDLDKTNNHISNLEWITREDNIKHAQMNSLKSTPSKSVIEIDAETKEMKIYRSIYEAAKEELGYKASEKELEPVRKLISQCCKGKIKIHKGKYYFFNIGDNINRIEELIEERQKYTKEQRELIKINELNDNVIRYRIKTLGMSIDEAVKYKKSHRFRETEPKYRENSKLLLGIGRRFGKLVVLDVIREKGKKAKYKCKCDCGGEKIAEYSNLWIGKVKSCGCLNNDTSKK